MLAAMGTADLPGTMARVERISFPDFCAMQEEWNELLQSSKSDCLFLTWEWIQTWWNHLADDREFAVVAVRSGDLLIALAPMGVRPRNLTRLLPEAEFLGSGLVGSDYLDFIVRDGFEAEAGQLLSSDLAGRNVTVKLSNLRHHECQAECFASLPGLRNWRLIETKINICPFIPLKAHTWETYLASLGSEHRYNLQRKSKRLNRDRRVRIEQARTHEQCREGIDQLITLHNLRWQSRGGSDALHTAELVEFHRALAPLALERGWLRLFTLWVDDRAAACLYGFIYQNKFYFYQSGFHPDFEKDSVGLVLMGIAIKSAIEESVDEFDFLHGDESYKRHWTRGSRVLSRLELYPPTSLGWLSRSARELVRAARSRVSRARNRSAAS